MTDRDPLQQQMLELIYGLLTDEESAELAERISSDRGLAVAYAELKEQTELLADATRAVTSAPPDFAAWKKAAATEQRPAPGVPDSHGAPSAGRWVSRTLQIVSALAACLLLLAVGYPYFAADSQGELAVARQQADLADDFLAVSVTGPRLMAARLSNRFEVSIQNAAQEPVDAQVEYTFKSPTGGTVYFGRTQAVAGEVIAEIPPDEVSNAATLEVVARHGEARSHLGLDLQVAPQKPIAILQTDRPFAEPGETINFRAVVLDPQTQQEQPTQLDFYWQSAETAQLAEVPGGESQATAGVTTGQLPIPEDRSLDTIQLAVRSPLIQSEFAQVEVPVMAAEQQSARLFAKSNFQQQREPRQQAFAAQGRAFHVVPEGGNLVAGVQNRIYYQALSQALTPLPGQAQVVDAQKQLIQGLPPSQTELGWFLLVPEATQQYSLELNQAAQQFEQPLAPVQQLPATLQVTNGVAPADQPLEVDVRVAQAHTTMALVVGDDGATIGHHLWDVGANAPITQPITLDLPSGATGAQRVRLYQVSDEVSAGAAPRLLAERIVYRTPVRRFDIDVEGFPGTAEPGQALNLQIDITNEYDSPAPATLGVQLHAIPPGGAIESPPLGLEAAALLTSRVRLPVGGQPLPDALRDLEQDPARFDQLLALSQWREPASLPVDQPLIADTRAPSAEPLPVVHRSNLAAMLEEYESAVAQLQAGWQSRLEQIRWTSSWLLIGAGGMLSVCLLALALVQGLPRVGVWGPGLLVALGSVLWGLLSFNLPIMESMSPNPTLIARHEMSDAPPAPAHSLGETSALPLSKAEGDTRGAPATMRLRTAPAPARTNAFAEEGGGGLGGGSMAPPAQPEADTEAAAPRMMRRSADAAAPAAAPPAEASETQPTASRFEPVLWEPRLATNSQGQANLAVTLPETPGRYRLLIDAHGSGRLGTIVRYIDVADTAAPQ